MARVTYVKAAQQRYRTVPVLDEAGKPVVRTVHRKRPTKRGKTEFTQRVTREDRDQPLPPLRCDFPGCTIDGGAILPGSPYKWVKPKSGPYGGHQRNRHAQHPSWQPWDLSSSMGATLQRIQHDNDPGNADTMDDVRSVAENAAQEIRDLAEQKRESAENIREGFQHDTYQSEELDQVADDLDGWADDVENALDSAALECQECDGGQKDCDTCQGSGQAIVDGESADDPEPCPDCDSGQVECDACDGTGEDIEAARDAVQEALDACPV